MTTKAQIIGQIKKENPTLKLGNDINGYTEIIGADYEVIILDWAENRFLKETAALEAQAEAEATAAAKAALLARLGITDDEAKLLLE
jgi:hypothetical protein